MEVPGIVVRFTAVVKCICTRRRLNGLWASLNPLFSGANGGLSRGLKELRLDAGYQTPFTYLLTYSMEQGPS